MELVAQPSEPLSPSEIARDWTARGHPVSRQYVDRLMRRGVGGEKLAGEHVLTIEAAWQWRTVRTRILKTAKGGGVSAQAAATAGPSLPPPHALGDAGDNTLDAELERVRGLVREQAWLWQEAVRAKPYDAFAAARARKEYQEAVNTRVEVEGLIADFHKSLGLSVSLIDAQQLIDQRLSPLRSALHSLDKELAREFFPEDPAKNRPRFRRVIARAVVASLAIARAKKRLFTAAVPNVSPRAA